MKSVLFLIFGIEILFACTSATVPSPISAPLSVLTQPEDLIELKLPGQQTHPSFSPSGNKIVYVSWDRKDSKLKQLYEYDLLLQHEQRITYQDGFTESPSYWDEKLVLYSSNTDELKENDFLETSEAKSDWLDIYISDLVGENIQRLTQRAGLDDKALRDPWSSDRLFFISRNPQPGLYWISTKAQKRQLLFPGTIESYSIRKSNKSLFGFEKTQTGRVLFEYQLDRKQKRVLVDPIDALLAISDTPWTDIFLVSQLGTNGTSNLILWNPIDRCAVLWKSLAGRVTSLNHSPKDTGLYVISIERASQEKIFLLKGLPPVITCPKDQSSDKL